MKFVAGFTAQHVGQRENRPGLGYDVSATVMGCKPPSAFVCCPSLQLLLISPGGSPTPFGDTKRRRADGTAPVKSGRQHLSVPWPCSTGKMIPQRMLQNDRQWHETVCLRWLRVAGDHKLRTSPSAFASGQLPSVTCSCSVCSILSGCLLRHGVWRGCGYASGALIRCLDAF